MGNYNKTGASVDICIFKKPKSDCFVKEHFGPMVADKAVAVSLKKIKINAR